MKKRIEVSKGKKFGKSVCSLYGERDFNRYIDDAMTPLEMERFEAHSENCDDCLRTLQRIDEEKKNAEFIGRTLKLID